MARNFCEETKSKMPKQPEAIRKCDHGNYWPRDQKFAHGCSFCNPQEPDLTPEKTFAVFRILHGSELEKIKLHTYGTKVQYTGGRAMEMLARYNQGGVHLHGTAIAASFWHSAVPHV
jgi:hypothetical protein